MRRQSLIAIVSAATLTMCGSQVTSQTRDVGIDVQFKLTDLDYKPIADAPVRVVFGSDADWQEANTGRRFLTDQNGEYRFHASVRLDKQPRQVPTNFVGSLVSGVQLTDHLLVAAELEYMTFRWLYAVDVCRFPNGGDVLLDGFSVYTAAGSGRFVNKAREDKGGWYMPELKGMALTGPGHEPWDFMLAPDPGDPKGDRWTLKLAFKRSPAPIRR